MILAGIILSGSALVGFSVIAFRLWSDRRDERTGVDDR